MAFKIVDNILVRFVPERGLTNVVIPDGIEIVTQKAFFRCQSIRSVIIPGSVIEVEDNAFACCKKLEKVVFNEGTTSIGQYAFSDCRNLRTVIISKTIEDIGSCAFEKCYRLAEICNLSNLKIEKTDCEANGYLGNFAKDIYKTTDFQSKLHINDTGCIIHTDENHCQTLIGCIGKSSELNIPEGVSYINQHALRGEVNITAVNIPESVNLIGECAFCGCINLKTVNFAGRKITAIPSKAFKDCIGLKNFYVPASIETIGTYAFAGEKPMSLKHFTFENGSKLKNINSFVFSNCTELEEINLPVGLKNIGDGAFHRCESLKNLTLPDGLSDVGMGFLNGCKNLQSIVVPRSLACYGDDKYNHCRCITDLHSGVISNLNSPSKKAIYVNGFLQNYKLYDEDVRNEYVMYLIRTKKDNLTKIFEYDCVDILKMVLLGININVLDFESMCLLPAQNLHAEKCLEFLQNWQKENITPEKIAVAQERELNKDPFNVDYMKKLWKFDKLDDNTVSLTTYRGEEHEITLPPRIGKRTVRAIERINYIYSNVHTIVIPPNITNFTGTTFWRCDKLSKLIIEDPTDWYVIKYDPYTDRGALDGRINWLNLTGGVPVKPGYFDDPAVNAKNFRSDHNKEYRTFWYQKKKPKN